MRCHESALAFASLDGSPPRCRLRLAGMMRQSPVVGRLGIPRLCPAPDSDIKIQDQNQQHFAILQSTMHLLGKKGFGLVWIRSYGFIEIQNPA